MKNNKILNISIILSILFAFIFLNTSSVFARTVISREDNYILNDTFDEMSYFLIYRSRETGKYILVCSKEPFYLSKVNGGGGYIESTVPWSNSNDNWKTYTYFYVKGSSSMYNGYTSVNQLCQLNLEDYNNTGSTSSTILDYTDENSIVYCNFDLYTKDYIHNTNNLTLLYEGATHSTFLAETLENSNPNNVLNEVINLLGVVLVIVVAFIGIRKGIAFLTSLLQNS